MKCKICGFEILDGQTVCPGCGSNVEELKSNNNVIIEKKIVEDSTIPNPIDLSSMSESSSLVADSLASEVAPTEVVTPVQPEVAPTEVVTPVQPEVAPTEVVTPVQPEVAPTEVVTPVQPEVAPTEVVTPVQPEVAPTEVVTPVQPEVAPTEVVTPVNEDLNVPFGDQPLNQTSTESVSEVALPQENLNIPLGDTPVTPVVNENVKTLDEVVPTPKVELKKAEEPMASLDVDKKEGKKKKKGGALKVVLIILLVIILLLVGGAAYFHFIYGSAKNVYDRTISGVANELNNTLKLDGDSKALTANVGFTYQTSDQNAISLDFLNRLKLSINSQIDSSNKGSVFNLVAKYNDSTLELTNVNKDSKSYLYLKDIFDKYLDVTVDKNESVTPNDEIALQAETIDNNKSELLTQDNSDSVNEREVTDEFEPSPSLPIESTKPITNEEQDYNMNDEYINTSSNSLLDFNLVNGITTHNEEMKRVFTAFGNAFKESINEEDLTKSYEQKEINGSNKYVVKTTYTLTDETYKELVMKALTTLKGNEQAINDLCVLTNKTESEVKESINNYLVNLNVEFKTMDINIYTDLTTIKLYKIEINESNEKSTSTIEFEAVEDGYKLNIQSDNTTLTFDSIEKTASVITENNGVSFGIEVNSYNIETIDNVVYPDVSEAVKEEALTEDEQNTITSKLMNNELIKNVISSLMNFMF